MADVKPIPDGYPQVIPYLVVNGAEKAIEFYSSVLGAKERMRMGGPGGKVAHAELEVGDSVIMLADEFPEMGAVAPKSNGEQSVSIMVYVDDVDAVFERALKAGATSKQPLENKFYGDRSGVFDDPFGHTWNVSTHVEDVPPEEMEKRMAEMEGGQG